MTLRAVIEGAGLSLPACATTLGVDPDLFQQWADSQREMPPTYVALVSAVLGVKAEAWSAKGTSKSRTDPKSEPAAIWFKFRGKEFTSADRESILSVRQLGHHANQLEVAVDGQANRSWTLLFKNVLEAVDLQDSPQAQGRAAARAFCGFTQFGHGGKGSAEYLRGSLRAKGILLIESPLPKSDIEGCSFLVGDSSSQRPCLFVNAYRSTWFRRNVVIMHELGHAIFDQTSGVEIDKLSDASGSEQDNAQAFTEIRAESFARECLLPQNLILSFFSSHGVKASKLLPDSLAALVAFSGVEKKTVIEVLKSSELIDAALATTYESFDISSSLRAETLHALSTREYIDKIGLASAKSWLNKRFTTTTPQRLLLPVSYVKNVLEAAMGFKISLARAAELLMIDPETFHIRFAEAISEGEE